MIVEHGQEFRAAIFKVCREQQPEPKAGLWTSSSIESFSHFRVEELSANQVADVFKVLRDAMEASGEPNPIPSDAQLEAFLTLVVNHHEILLEDEIHSMGEPTTFLPVQVNLLVGNSKETQVYGHLEFPRVGEMVFSLDKYATPRHRGQAFDQKISPSNVQFTSTNASQWMSLLQKEASRKSQKSISKYNLLRAIATARLYIKVRDLSKAPYDVLKHHLSFASDCSPKTFIKIAKCLAHYPFLATFQAERPETVFQELYPNSNIFTELMQKIDPNTRPIPVTGTSDGLGKQIPN